MSDGPSVYGHPYMPPRPEGATLVRRRIRKALVGAGILCIVAGLVMVAVPLYGVWQRGNADSSAINSWQSGGSNTVVGPAPSADPHVTCGSSAANDVALVQFTDPAGYNYAGVAGNGDWNMLHQRSMVHYTTTPMPGQKGNVIIAFHREPNYEHIDKLGVGGIITIQDKECHTYRYKVTQRWTLYPNDVTQLVPTDGHELTLITCTPFWVDTQRLVWRAELITGSN